MQGFPVYVCRQTINPADKSKTFLYMSATRQMTRQTNLRLSCICLSPDNKPGRQIQGFPVYVCRQAKLSRQINPEFPCVNFWQKRMKLYLKTLHMVKFMY